METLNDLKFVLRRVYICKFGLTARLLKGLMGLKVRINA